MDETWCAEHTRYEESSCAAEKLITELETAIKNHLDAPGIEIEYGGPTWDELRRLAALSSSKSPDKNQELLK